MKKSTSAYNRSLAGACVHFPQVGDTMDMDNQIPGGFFARGMTKAQEDQVVAKFQFYETFREGIEQLSPTKHYERVSFALLNVKPGFESNTPIQVLGLKWVDFGRDLWRLRLCWFLSLIWCF